jgi:hypothetical protein
MIMTAPSAPVTEQVPPPSAVWLTARLMHMCGGYRDLVLARLATGSDADRAALCGALFERHDEAADVFARPQREWPDDPDPERVPF